MKVGRPERRKRFRGALDAVFAAAAKSEVIVPTPRKPHPAPEPDPQPVQPQPADAQAWHTWRSQAHGYEAWEAWGINEELFAFPLQ